MSKKVTAAQRLYEDLKHQIATRQILPGTLLPSENELCEQYAISRPTVRRVQEKLCSLNMIEKRPGIGTFVRSFDNREPEENSTFCIGLDSFTEQSSHYYGKIVQGITGSRAGKNCTFSFFERENLARGLFPAQADALLMMKMSEENEPAAARAAAEGKPVLAVNRTSGNPNIAYLAIDHRREAEFAVEHLIRLGHRKIAVIGDSTRHFIYHIRGKGWEDALRHAGLEVPQQLRLDVEDMFPVDSRARAFIRDESFTAVFFTNLTNMRTFITEYSRLHGEKVDQLELMCFDDLDGQEDLEYLTCSYVRMPLRKMGALAADYLRNKLADPQFPPMRKLVPCNLVIRHQLD